MRNNNKNIGCTFFQFFSVISFRAKYSPSAQPENKRDLYQNEVVALSSHKIGKCYNRLNIGDDFLYVLYCT
jgi:hypothetical protein